MTPERPAAGAAETPRPAVSEDTAVLLMQLSSSSKGTPASSSKRKHKDEAKVKGEDASEPATKRAAGSGGSSGASEEEDGDSEPYNKKRGSLPKSTTNLLKAWLFDHHGHPYPTENEKQEMAQKFGLTVNQISNWFINARRRILQPMKEKAKKFLVQHNTNNNSDSTDEIVHNALKRCVQDVTQSLGQPSAAPIYDFQMAPQGNMMAPVPAGGQMKPQGMVMESGQQGHPQPQYVILPPGANMNPHMISGPVMQQQMMQPQGQQRGYPGGYVSYPPSTAVYHSPYPQQHMHPHMQYIPTTSYPASMAPAYQGQARAHPMQPMYVSHDMMGAPPATHPSS